MPKRKIIYTIGHSNRTLSYFLDLLETYQIETLIDVRTIPRSRHNPQFNLDILPSFLKEKQIAYIPFGKKLGGLRRVKKDSVNIGWHNASFRGFADYMQTQDFKEGLAELMEIAKESRCVLMCAEALPWRCHRSLISDALTLKKWQVFHIQSKKTAKLHELTPFLHVIGRKVIYC